MKQFLKNTYLVLVYVFFYLPIAVLILYSFNDAQYSMAWQGFTLDWYKQLLTNSNLLNAAVRSVTLAFLAATIATAIGTLGSISLYRCRFPGKRLLYGLIFILILIPDILMGIALLIAFNLTLIPLGFTSLLLAHITLCIPFVVLTIHSRMELLDQNLFEAARDLGASEWRILFQITLPLLFPAILAAFLLSFTLSLDDVMISYFVAGPSYEILPLKIYSLVRSGLKPEVNAICAILFALTLFLILCAQYFLRKTI